MTTAAGGLKVIIAEARVPARAPAPRQAADRARGSRRAQRVECAALRRRSRRVHRRQVVHAPQRLPVADPAATTRIRCGTTRSPTWTTTCVGCGLCGEVAHAAVLCPSFYEARSSTNPPVARWAPLRVAVVAPPRVIGAAAAGARWRVAPPGLHPDPRPRRAGRRRAHRVDRGRGGPPGYPARPPRSRAWPSAPAPPPTTSRSSPSARRRRPRAGLLALSDRRATST